MSWTVSLPCTRAQAEAMTRGAAGFDDDQTPVIAASEVDEARDLWRIDAYFADKPRRRTVEKLAAMTAIKPAKAPRPVRVVEADWVTLSQSGLPPVRAGRFHVHTGADAPDDAAGIVNFRIDAAQAFGTGHHETTAGCLAMLDALQRSGRRYRAVIDIGTGTGLLAFSALHLWPRARAVASDIDPVSVAVSLENAAVNGVAVHAGGARRAGAVTLLAADGTDHPRIAAAAPYDLVIANILAGPLIALAPAIAAITAPGGTLILAGLLHRQSAAVARAYRRVGFRLDRVSDASAWPTLRLTMRPRPRWHRPLRARGGAGQAPGDFGTW